MKINLPLLTVTLLCFIISNIGNCQIAKRIDSLALEYMEKGFNGNILYSKNDSILFTGNYGFSDFSIKRPLNDSTIFDLASLVSVSPPTYIGHAQVSEKA